MSKRFIVQINPAGWLTLAGLAIDLAAFFLLLDMGKVEGSRALETAASGESRFFLAISLMYLGMLADAFDGIVARKFRMESEFGRYLDGFVDVFNYLVLPNMALWRLGFSGPPAAAVMSVMIACGVLRLSKFNIIGNIKDEKGDRKYLGMPVFWSQLLFFPLFSAHVFLGAEIFFAACAVVWTAMSIAFIYNSPFFKPKNPWIIAGITLSLSIGALVLFLMDRHP